MKIWISRDFKDRKDYSCVNLTENKPHLGTEEEYNKTWIFPSTGYLGFMKTKEFEKKFNLKVPNGYCKQHRLTISKDSLEENGEKHHIVKKAGKDYKYDFSHFALTLEPHFLGKNDSGWEIQGEIKEDYYEWINYFEAKHPKYGKLFGDFEDKIFAENEKSYQHFIKHHKPTSWDYWDI